MTHKRHAWSWQLSKTARLNAPRATAPSLDQWQAAVVNVQLAGQAALRLMQTLPHDTGALHVWHT